MSAFLVVPVEVSKISCDDHAVSELVHSVSAQSDDSAHFPLVSDATPPTCTPADLRISHTPTTSSTNLPSRRARKKSSRAPLLPNPEPAIPEDLSHQPVKEVQESLVEWSVCEAEEEGLESVLTRDTQTDGGM